MAPDRPTTIVEATSQQRFSDVEPESCMIQIGSCARPFFPGRVLNNRYRLLERLGKGGMGVVFMAEDTLLLRKVAVKIVRADRADDLSIRKRLLKESRIGAVIAHENVVRILDAGTLEDGIPYLVFELVDGSTLASILNEQGRLPLPRALHMIAQITAAVSAVHELKITHRDLKPNNIMVQLRSDGSDFIKVLDFGIAKEELSPDESEATLTQAGAGGGTPHYMAPEVARGETNGDKSVDVYAIGAICYELLSGQRAYPGEGRNAVIYNVIQGKPKRLGSLVKHLPNELETLVLDALSPKISRRPSIEDFRARLGAIQRKNSRSMCAGLDLDAQEPSKRRQGSATVVRWLGTIGACLMLYALGYGSARLGNGKSVKHIFETQKSVEATLIAPQVESAAISLVPTPPRNSALVTLHPLAMKTESQREFLKGEEMPSRAPFRGKNHVDKKSKTAPVRTDHVDPHNSPTSPELSGFETENPY